MRVYLVDGTYELFRHYFGAPPHYSPQDGEIGAVRGVLDHLLGSLGREPHPGLPTPPALDPSRTNS